MNIFVLHRHPILAAKRHCDKHVVKMILETAQLLYSAHHVLGPGELPEGAYKKTHANHPCALWVRESLANYSWLAQLGWYLCKEYQHRYGDTKTHKTERHIVWLQSNPPATIPNVPKTPFRMAMPDVYKHEDPVVAYQTFYRESKLRERGIVTYTRRAWPEFLIESKETPIVRQDSN
jgi:hypothetical protein